LYSKLTFYIISSTLGVLTMGICCAPHPGLWKFWCHPLGLYQPWSTLYFGCRNSQFLGPITCTIISNSPRFKIYSGSPDIVWRDLIWYCCLLCLPEELSLATVARNLSYLSNCSLKVHNCGPIS